MGGKLVSLGKPLMPMIRCSGKPAIVTGERVDGQPQVVTRRQAVGIDDGGEIGLQGLILFGGRRTSKSPAAVPAECLGVLPWHAERQHQVAVSTAFGGKVVEGMTAVILGLTLSPRGDCLLQGFRYPLQIRARVVI